jgi:methylated-DNA-[protein]-cysteine S-methyltransferase
LYIGPVKPAGATDSGPIVFDALMHENQRFAVAPTALGAIGVVWSERGILGTWMHAGTPDRARAHVRRTFPGAIEASPPPPVAAALDEIGALLAGEPRDLGRIELDMDDVPEFDRRVYVAARTIPPGSTMTYGAIAKALGEEPMRARDVGIALARNPFAPIVPCHRVVAAGGRLGGYSAPGGTATKRRLLELEGAEIVAAPEQATLFEALGRP